jgi:hypothetical protein
MGLYDPAKSGNEDSAEIIAFIKSGNPAIAGLFNLMSLKDPAASAS